MSFLSGPECSTGANPLAQFQKQTSADTSLQRDRLTSRQPGALNGFRSQQSPQGNGAFAEFQEQGPMMQEPMDPVAFEQMRRELEAQTRQAETPNWAREFSPMHDMQHELSQRPTSGGFSPAEFQAFGNASPAQRAVNPAFQQQGYQRPPMGISTFQRPMYGGMGFQSRFAGSTFQQPQQFEGKGKQRVTELDDQTWQEQFDALNVQGDDTDMEALDREAEEAVERELNGIDHSETGFGDFENIWEAIKRETNAARDMVADEDDFAQIGDDYVPWKDFDQSSQTFDGLRTHDLGSGGPQLGGYLFEENNLFSDVPNAFEEGQKIMREGGNLSLAALAFEAAVQRSPDMVEAWVALGQAQAQNEKESPAIRALEHALELDDNNLDALMGLSVSYTNEGYDSLAYRTLERWVTVKYPRLNAQPPKVGDEADIGFTDRHQLHERVTGLFLEAAQLAPEGAEVDCDVQVGLGVLFYGTEDYEKAVDCFTAALNSAQHGSLKKEGEEHLLWNRLGATLANSGRSEEAIEAYSRALEIRSNFVRARYNLGVSCINLGVLEEAAGHLLGALSMHRVLESEGRQKAAELVGGGDRVDDAAVEGLLQQNQSTNLYDTLRRVFGQLNRRDLSDMVGPDMNLDALRGEFEF